MPPTISPTVSVQISRKPWIMYLPDELLIQLIYCTERHGALYGCLELIEAFPDLTRFTLVIIDASMPHIMSSLEGTKFKCMKKVSIQQYATLDYNECRRRPVKFFLLHFDRLQLPTIWFDGTDKSLFGRFLNQDSIVYSSGGPAMEQLCSYMNVHHNCVISPCSADIMSQLGIIQSEPEMLDCNLLNVPEAHYTDPKLQSLCVFNCTNSLSFSCPSSLRRFEIDISKECLSAHNHPNECQQLYVNIHHSWPSELLHVKFSSDLVPRINVLDHIVDINQDNPKASLVLENSDWTPTTPYGLSICSDQNSVLDQASWNLLLPFRMRITKFYHVLYFVGIPDSILVRCGWDGVVFLNWRRLSSRSPREYFEYHSINGP